MFGRKFGKLTVISKDVVVRKNSKKYWKVRCDCGREKLIYEYCLLSGGTKTCNNCSGSRDGKIGDVFDKLTIVGDRERINKRTYYPTICSCGNPEIKMARADLLFSSREKNNGCGRCVEFDIIGKKFNRWLVQSFSGRGKRNTPRYNVVCECGNLGNIARDDLLLGASKSCGCLAAEVNGRRVSYDLTGKTFGRLTVVERMGRNKWGNWTYKCKCECGSIIENVPTSSLTSGSTKSCGCYSRELSSKRLTGLTREKNYKWNPDLTDKERESRRYDNRYSDWRNSIYKIFNYTCDVCESKGKELNAHHLHSYRSNKNTRFDLDNGVCICKKCHVEFHRKYGYGKNTPEQYYEFKTKVSI